MNPDNRHPHQPLLVIIGLGQSDAAATFRSNKKSVLEAFMHSRNATARARARLQLETPISGDEDLLKLQDQAVEYISEAKRRDPAGPNELVSSVIDAVARDYVGHVIRKQRRRAGES
jgi:TPP-dependent pyruvate/acetoin dehydrogenase alpha subunit